MLKSKLLVVCLLLNSLILNAQYPGGVDPKLIIGQTRPVGTEVAAMTRYSMSPPSQANGLPQQNIPLFEITENGISYPLSLFYSYSGFRVKEDASAIGLGWGLTEGMIIRVVKHVADEHYGLMKKFSDLGPELDYENGYGTLNDYFYTNPIFNVEFSFTMNRLYYKLYDGQPDLYIYNFNGHVGKFFWINDQAVMLEQTDITVKREVIIGTNKIVFTLITPDGLTYTFNEADYTLVTPSPVIAPLDCNNNPVTTHTDPGYTTAWRLKEIKNNLTQAKMTFKYSSNTSSNDKAIEQTTSVTFPAEQMVNGQYWCNNFNKEESFARTVNAPITQ